MNERLDHGIAGFQDRYRSADRGRLGRQHRVGELAQIVVVVGIAARQRLDADQAIFGFPLACKIGRQGLETDRLRLQ